MNISIFAKQALITAMSITGTDGSDSHTQKIAFKLACLAMAKEMAGE